MGGSMQSRQPVKNIAIFALLLAFTTIGCNQEINASIRAMNEGIAATENKNYEEALGHLKTATGAYAQNHEAWYAMGQIYHRQRKWEEAAKAFAEAVRHSQSEAMYHMALGITLYEGEKRKQALTHIEKAIELNGKLFRAHWYAGRIYRDLGNPQKAASAWTTACELNPVFGGPFVRLGELYLRWDKFDEAVAVLRQGAKHVKGDADRTNVFYYLGQVYQTKGAWTEAIQAYSQAITERADNYDALLQRGLSYKAKGDKVKAKADLQAYVKQGGGKNAFNRQEANKALFELM